jgi:hypothetical protein
MRRRRGRDTADTNARPYLGPNRCKELVPHEGVIRAGDSVAVFYHHVGLENGLGDEARLPANAKHLHELICFRCCTQRGTQLKNKGVGGFSLWGAGRTPSSPCSRPCHSLQCREALAATGHRVPTALRACRRWFQRPNPSEAKTTRTSRANAADHPCLLLAPSTQALHALLHQQFDSRSAEGVAVQPKLLCTKWQCSSEKHAGA